ncbi:MAG: GNAT family N-acyltransferase, partial [Bacteroidota bacterium]
MPQLVSKEDFIHAIGLDQYFMSSAAGPLMRVTGISRMNRIYDKIGVQPGEIFLRRVLEFFEIDLEIKGNGLDLLPSEGSFITLSNHPFGIWDGLILMKLLLEQRKDFKVMGNFLLQQITPIRDYVLAVNPFEGLERSSFSGMKQSLKHIKEGHPLGIFPAGEVSSFQTRNRRVSDRAWQKQVIKLVAKTRVPVVPIYFEGSNSNLFHLMGLIHPSLRTAALPTEMLRRKRSKIVLHIGKPILPKEYAHINNTDRLSRYLRARTYALGSELKVNPFFKRRNFSLKKQKAVNSPISVHLIEKEIKKLRKQSLVCAQQEFEVFEASPREIPNILQELGRLREITFRAVGEGTGDSIDLDEYDLYYRHLFLWDKEEQQIVGAYRMGPGPVIMERYGKKGFYTHSLFRMKNGMKDVLEQSLELGRSFILPAYQKKRLPLFLLWKGISTYLENNPNYKYVIGPVSISNAYSELSKQFIVSLIKKYYFDPELAVYIKARKRFLTKIKQVDVSDLLDGPQNNLKMADRLIDEMDRHHSHLPILLKKYIKQNARIIGFNIDPKFSNALDGLMILKVDDL